MMCPQSCLELQSPNCSSSKGTTENSHIRHCERTSESSNVKLQNIQHGEKRYLYYKLLLQNSCNTIYPRNMVCCRYIIVNTVGKGGNE